MKHFAIIGIVLAASQCPIGQQGEQKSATKADASKAEETSPDAGEADAGAATAIDVGTRALNLEAGPPPFDVPTKRTEILGMAASIVVPEGTRIEQQVTGVSVILGEGKNFWLHVSEDSVDLAEVRARIDSETEPLDRYEDAVVWNEGEFWFFEHSGAFSCSNPPTARHDLGDVKRMIASCRSIRDEDPEALVEESVEPATNDAPDEE